MRIGASGLGTVGRPFYTGSRPCSAADVPSMSTVALVVAAGSGTRAPGERPKQYRLLAGEPVLRRTIRRLRACTSIDAVRVVIDPEHRDFYEESVGDLGLPAPIAGGASRRESVRCGLEALAGEPPARILVHDAARPLVSPQLSARIVSALAGTEAAIPVLPVTDSLRRVVGNRIREEVPRAGVHRVQTPQGFAFGAILEAHRRVAAASATDDSAIALAAGMEVHIVPGEEDNIKLTLPEDFLRAERILAAERPRFRTGFGYDVHAVDATRPLVLCGVKIAGGPGLAGHSDADVGLHALTDALLATIGAGDIGSHFPPEEERWRNASSRIFLEHARNLVAAAGGRIEHVDVTMVCETPRLAPHSTAMRERIGELLGLPSAAVSVKATTSEGLGFIGRREGIAAYAVATVSLPPGETDVR